MFDKLRGKKPTDQTSSANEGTSGEGTSRQGKGKLSAFSKRLMSGGCETPQTSQTDQTSSANEGTSRQGKSKLSAFSKRLMSGGHETPQTPPIESGFSVVRPHQDIRKWASNPGPLPSIGEDTLSNERGFVGDRPGQDIKKAPRRPGHTRGLSSTSTSSNPSIIVEDTSRTTSIVESPVGEGSVHLSASEYKSMRKGSMSSIGEESMSSIRDGVRSIIRSKSMESVRDFVEEALGRSKEQEGFEREKYENAVKEIERRHNEKREYLKNSDLYRNMLVDVYSSLDVNISNEENKGFKNIKGFVEEEFNKRSKELFLGNSEIKDVKEKLIQEMLIRHKVDIGIWQMECGHVIENLRLETLPQWEEVTREIRREKVEEMWDNVPERPEISRFKDKENKSREEFDEDFLKSSIRESISPSDKKVIQGALSIIEGKIREELQNYIKAEESDISTLKILNKNNASLEEQIGHVNNIREKEFIQGVLSIIEGKIREELQNYIKAEESDIATPRILNKNNASLEEQIGRVNNIYDIMCEKKEFIQGVFSIIGRKIREELRNNIKSEESDIATLKILNENNASLEDIIISVNDVCKIIREKEFIQGVLSTIEGKRRKELQNYIKAEKSDIATPKILNKVSLEEQIGRVNGVYDIIRKIKENLPEYLEEFNKEEQEEIKALGQKQLKASQSRRSSVMDGLLVSSQIPMAVASPHFDTTKVRSDPES